MGNRTEKVGKIVIDMPAAQAAGAAASSQQAVSA
jgi:hypothetical protein